LIRSQVLYPAELPVLRVRSVKNAMFAVACEGAIKPIESCSASLFYG
jgi:hypothetical protein